MSSLEGKRSHKFPRQQRLRKKKSIDALFKNGKQKKIDAILIYYLPNTEPSVKHHQVLFSVSRKLYPRAVDRNKIKRRLREAYRKNKYILEYNSKLGVPFLLGYVYISRNILSYVEIEKQVRVSLNIIKQSIENI